MRILTLLCFTLLLLPSAARAENSDTLRLLDLFGDVFEKVRKEYVEEPADKELIENAINGMLTSLDPHSSYLNEEAFKEMQVQTRGEFGGLGIVVTMKNGMVYVISPIDDSPAFKKGIQAGDYFSHIDGESVIGMDVNEAVSKMRGKPGTDIELTVLREDVDEPFDVTITRDIIKIQSVRSNVQDDVGYIRITNFSEQTDRGLKKELEKIREEIGEDKFQGLVLDLRNNPGGLLNQAVAVADAFLERGEVVSTRERDPKNTKRFNATSGDVIEGLPLVVLINGGSASASEIVAGALQDHRRAIVMGTKSFGKGSVQTVIPLPRDSAIRLTTSLYYTPSGNSIQAEGIEPDILVEPAKLEFLNNANRTSEANLRGHLDNANVPLPKEGKGEENNGASNNGDNASESLYETDYQLARAVDLVRSLYMYQQPELRMHTAKKNFARNRARN